MYTRKNGQNLLDEVYSTIRKKSRSEKGERGAEAVQHETVHCNFYTSLLRTLRPSTEWSRKTAERGFGSYLLVLLRRSSRLRPNHPNRKNRIACLWKSDSAHTEKDWRKILVEDLEEDFSHSAFNCEGSCIAWRMQKPRQIPWLAESWYIWQVQPASSFHVFPSLPFRSIHLLWHAAYTGDSCIASSAGMCSYSKINALALGNKTNRNTAIHAQNHVQIELDVRVSLRHWLKPAAARKNPIFSMSWVQRLGKLLSQAAVPLGVQASPKQTLCNFCYFLKAKQSFQHFLHLLQPW